MVPRLEVLEKHTEERTASATVAKMVVVVPGFVPA